MLLETEMLGSSSVIVLINRYLLFADDNALNSSMEAGEQYTLCSVFSTACKYFSLTTSNKTTEVLHEPAPGCDYTEPCSTVSGQKLNNVDRFAYLGTTLSQAVSIDEEMNTRIARASTALGRLRSNTWDRRGIKTETQLKVYSPIVLPALLLYVCDTSTLYSYNTKI